MIRLALKFFSLVLLSLALGACSFWHQRSQSFDSYAEFAASPIAREGVLPEDLLPHSARNIRFKQDTESKEVEASFDFDPGDEEAVVRPFLSVEQLQIRLAIADGIIPPSAAPAPSLLLRCRPGPMEFLQIDAPSHAKYWTSFDPKQRESACTNKGVG
jgi:hypothetical protein